ncbi:hypothetical protein PHLCEN_2v7981 [Hermanssonia centrifuga]|uniref:Uncharacterized protein n=1 Tax=Hermanssonia centrifuga TaxID=98765 RepID=A0A2R6NV12_9APHY|nr:hypothetical protein PHLCEN_2v7981 [Hermanssonia centrifuga]
MSDWPTWLAVNETGSDSTAAQFYLDHPDGRVVSSFFLGCVFVNSLHYLVSSVFVRFAVRKARDLLRTTPCLSRSRRARIDPEAPFTLSEKAAWAETRSLEQYNDHSSLVFTLNLCLVFASFAMFLSLLVYSVNTGDAGCGEFNLTLLQIIVHILQPLWLLGEEWHRN